MAVGCSSEREAGRLHDPVEARKLDRKSIYQPWTHWYRDNAYQRGADIPSLWLSLEGVEGNGREMGRGGVGEPKVSPNKLPHRHRADNPGRENLCGPHITVGGCFGQARNVLLVHTWGGSRRHGLIALPVFRNSGIRGCVAHHGDSQRSNSHVSSQ